MTIPESLIRQLSAGRVLPFVGSGVSLSVKPGLFPTWSQLLIRLADRLDRDAKAKPAQLIRLFVEMDRLNEAADEALKALGNADFAREMRECFQVNQPGDADLSLAAALWRLQPRLLVTTNYDDALRWPNAAAEPIVNSQTAELAELLTRPTVERPCIWHLHGHIRDADSLILAPQQYDRLYREAADDARRFAAARQQLGNLLTNHPLLFVGFGLQDPYVMDALGVVLGMFGRYLRPSFALAKAGELPPDDVWRRHNIQVIEYEEHGAPLVRLVDDIGQRMQAAKAAGGGTTTTDAAPVVPAAYLDWLAEDCSDIDLLGMRVKEGHALCLHHVYVPPTTAAWTAEGAETEADSDVGLFRRMLGHKNQRKGRGQPEEQTAQQLLLDLFDGQSLYVSGDPGSGKSTFCRWVAWLASTGNMPQSDVAVDERFKESFPASLDARLPLLVRLREFWPHMPPLAAIEALTADQLQAALEKWLTQTRPGGLGWPDAASHLRRGSALLILDGVDEVPLSHGQQNGGWNPRALLLSGLATALPAWLDVGNRILLTSRPYGLTADQVRHLEKLGLPHAPIDVLTPPLQDVLVRRWFSVLVGDVEKGTAVANDMLRHVRSLPGIEPLAANPLLLTAMCIIYNEGKRLPQDKYDLYDRIVNTVLYSRYRDNPNEAEMVRWRLAAVALDMHTGQSLGQRRDNPEAQATYEQVGRMLEAYRQVSPETEAGLRDTVETREQLLARSGLFLPRGDRQAAFYHLSFQEFLAAERLVLLRRRDDDLLRAFVEHAAQPGWRNTLSFAFGCQVARHSWQAGVGLVERLLNRIDPDDVAASVGLALVVCDCFDILLGRRLQLQPPLVARFRQLCQAAIEQQVPLRPRFELAQALGRVGDPRVPTDLRDHDDRQAWVQIPADGYVYGDKKEPYRIDQPFLITRFPVTNAQFRLFLDQGGYEIQDLWSEQGWQWRTQKKVSEPSYWHDPKWNGPTQPVVGVSWYEADAFCRWAGGRLPGERQWEAAARGPDGLVYPWGDDWEDGVCNSAETKLQVTSPVGMFPRSRSANFALEDMAGNVWEWCEELYGEGGFIAEDRVLRGGAWGNPSLLCRAAVRAGNQPDNRDVNVGFRVLYLLQNSS